MQVKVIDVKRLKYLEVDYYPNTKLIDSNFEWDEEIKEFEEKEVVEEEAAAINS